ncbi:hypothetical protein HK096_011650, partial [Nowakowskiella sp. JEL0078]
MALHVSSPKISAFFDFYNSLAFPGCDSSCSSFAVYNDRCFCDAADLALFRNTNKTLSPVPFLLPIDHIFNPQSSSNIVILYSDLTSQSFVPFHLLLSQLASDPKDPISYVFRPKPAVGNDNLPSLTLAGYEVELMIKNQEYKVIDDRLNAIKTQEDANLELDIKENINDDAWLDTSEPQVVKLDSSEISLIGVITTYHILQSKNPLQTLAKITSDFPKYASTLAKKYSSSASVIALNNTVTEQGLALIHAKQAVFINHAAVDLLNLDLFTILSNLQRDQSIWSALQSFGIPPKLTRTLFSVREKVQGGVPWEGFDIRDDAVLWWNDLENDGRYRAWSKSINELLQPAWMNPLKYIRKNVFSLVVAVDLVGINKEAAKKCLEFLEMDVPLRFGLVATVTGDDSALAARAFYKILETKKGGRKMAKQFLTTLWNSIAKTPKANVASLVRSSYQEITKIELDLNNTPDVTDSLRAYSERFGIFSELGASFLNGQEVQINEAWAQNI